MRIIIFVFAIVNLINLFAKTWNELFENIWHIGILCHRFPSIFNGYVMTLVIAKKYNFSIHKVSHTSLAHFAVTFCDLDYCNASSHASLTRLFQFLHTILHPSTHDCVEGQKFFDGWLYHYSRSQSAWKWALFDIYDFEEFIDQKIVAIC